MGEVLGIKFEAIDFIFDIYQIRDPEQRMIMFEKVMAIDAERMKQRSEQIRRETPKPSPAKK